VGVAVNHPLEAEEHSPAHVEAWLLIKLLHRGIDRQRFSKVLPYDVSGLMSGDGEEFSPEVCQDELVALTQWLSKVAAEISRAGREQRGGTDASIIVRPEDFSLETAPGSARILSFRASSAKLGEPFFYVRMDHYVGQVEGRKEIILPASQLPTRGGSDRLAIFFQAQ